MRDQIVRRVLGPFPCAAGPPPESPLGAEPQEREPENEDNDAEGVMILQFPSEQGRRTPSLVWQAGNHRAEPVEPGTCERQPLGCELSGTFSGAGLTLCCRQLLQFFVEPIAHGWLAKQLQELAHLRWRRSGINGLRASSGGKDRGD